jgi:DNA-binding MarR family transcriptional regulator
MDELSIITEGFPTDPLGWLVAICSKLLREGLTTRFTNGGYGVTPEQWSMLAHLWQQDGLPQQLLADRFHRSKVAAFQLINKLETQGLVIRSSNPVDGRSNLIYLTPEGRAIESQLIPLAQANMVQALDGICEADVETAKSVIRKIIANMHG